MPKNSKKIRSAALEAPHGRNEPLGQVLATSSSSGLVRPKRKYSDHGDERTSTVLDEKSSQKILALSQQQKLEMEREEVLAARTMAAAGSPRKKNRQGSKQDSDDDSDDDEVERNLQDDHDDDDEYDYSIEQTQDGYVTLSSNMQMSAEDEALVASMMKGSEERKTLADIILEKIQEKEAETTPGNNNNNNNDNDLPPEQSLPPKVVQVYTEIGTLLSRYTSGKLPKAFKVIPSLTNWEEVLYLTRPDLWTPQAMFAATRIFASNLNPKMAQRFYELVLLDSVRADIYHNKKLNYHYYMALKKAVYKPAAFFKGILFPLCEPDSDCTLREAAIVASVLQRVSIPVHHAAVALHKLATQQDASSSSQYSGATSIFIKTLLNKKYSLPAPVIESLIDYFCRFLQYNDQELPVLWHQALLVFVQRYKREIETNEMARESFRLVMKKHFHHKITPEIRRELFGAQAFQEERKEITERMET